MNDIFTINVNSLIATVEPSIKASRILLETGVTLRRMLDGELASETKHVILPE